MKLRPPTVVYSVVALATACVVWNVNEPVRAQTAAAAPPAIRALVTTTVVKPEMVLAWQELQKETIPALKKASLPWRWVFNHGPVGPGFTYVSVQPVANFAQFDLGPALRRGMGDEAYANYQAKLRPMLVSTYNMVQTLLPNASLQSFSSKPPELVTVQNFQMLPGKGPEFARITETEFLPALKKAGVTDYWVFATTFGGSGGQRTIVQTASKYADYDPGPALTRAIGAEAAQKLNLSRSLLTSGGDITIMSLVPSLSFGAPARPPAGTK